MGRIDAIDKMATALDHYVIEGLNHNIPLLYDICKNKTFRSGELSTEFLSQEYPDGFTVTLEDGATETLAAVTALVHDLKRQRKHSFDEGTLPGFQLPKAFEAAVKIKGAADHQIHAI